MSEIPQISIANVIQGVTGKVYAEIINIESFANPNAYADTTKPVNVYKVKMKDTTGEIIYTDFCKKEGEERIYQVGDHLLFDNAIVKRYVDKKNPTDKFIKSVDTTSKIALWRNKTEIDRRDYSKCDAIAQNTQIISTPQELPAVPTASFAIPTKSEWQQVQTQFPSFYSAVDALFQACVAELSKPLQSKIIQSKGSLIKTIWGSI